MAANATSDVAFIVLMAGPAVNGEQISLLQTDLILRASGASEEDIAEQRALLEALFELARNVDDMEQTATAMRDVLMASFETLSEEELAALGDVETAIAVQISQLLSPWYQFFMTYDPMPALKDVTCPVLAINGSKDLQVPSQLNLSLIEQALQEGGNKNYTVLELADLNHLFQTAQTGSPDEYYLIEETMSPVALEVMGDWLVQVTGVK
jgi:fermentation-respiration switch protein FrsA (DUF1100 family)